MTNTSFKTKTQTDSRSRTRSGPRLFWVGMVLLLIVVVILGFWPTYFGPLFSGEAVGHPKSTTESWKIHMHGIVFLSWMGLLLIQTVLIARGNPQTHMRLGQYLAIFGLVLVGIGAYITYTAFQFLEWESTTWGEFLLMAWPNVETMLQFSLLLGLGYVYRTSPDTHKRYMFFATVALLYAAMDRMGYLLRGAQKSCFRWWSAPSLATTSTPSATSAWRRLSGRRSCFHTFCFALFCERIW